MRHGSLLLPCCLLVMAPPTVHADQFAYLDIRQAVEALGVLDGQPAIRKFCAPCGDADPQAVAVDGIGIERVWHWDGGAKVYTDGDGRSYWEVLVNDEGIDLAYVYVRGGDGRWENLAMLAGLSPSGVPRHLPASAGAD